QPIEPFHESTHPRPLPRGEQTFVRAVPVPLREGVRGGFKVPMHGKMAWSLSMNLLFGVPALAGPGRLKPERCSRKRGPRPSRSLCSASRRTAGAADSTHRLVRPDECSRLVRGTPTTAVGTTAPPLFHRLAPPEG